MDETSEQCRAAHHLRRRHFGITGLHAGLNGIEGRLINECRDRDRDHFVSRFQFLGLAALVELVATGIGLASQQPVDRADAPASAVAGRNLDCKNPFCTTGK